MACDPKNNSVVSLKPCMRAPFDCYERVVAALALNGQEHLGDKKILVVGGPVVGHEELEAVWAGKKTAKQALDAAVERGNAELARFAKANKK